MKNFVASVVALIVGFFTLALAAVMGILISITALIARPFIKRKVAAAYEEVAKQHGQNYTHNSGGTVIDGEYDDITDKTQNETKSNQYSHVSH